MTTIVREFSAAGPCLTLGTLVKETDKFFIFLDDGKQRRIMKPAPGRWTPAHTAPCPSCRDHANTQYPNGYMD